jgi:hypothetical protein
MTSPAAYVLAVVCEADADRRISTALADRILCEEVEWIEPESIDLHRRWQGLEGRSFLRWTEAVRLAKAIHAHGHFKGLPGDPDAFAARKALLLLMAERCPPDAVLLIRDSDGDFQRRSGLEQAREENPWPFAIILGLAHPKRECWVLAGFEPVDVEEKGILDSLRRELGFDPRTQAHDLTAKEAGARRDAKRVLATLTQGRSDREEACWTEGHLESLKARGAETGLADYLEEIRERLVPIFNPPSGR